MGWDFTFNIGPRGKEIQITSHLLKCKVPSIPGGRSPGEENDKCIIMQLSKQQFRLLSCLENVFSKGNLERHNRHNRQAYY